MTAPIGHANFAGDFIRIAEISWKEREQLRFRESVSMFCIQHAFELLFKSWALAAGQPEKSLRAAPVNHDLGELLKLANQRSLVKYWKFESDEEAQFVVLQRFANNHGNRYLITGRVPAAARVDQLSRGADRLLGVITKLAKEKKPSSFDWFSDCS